MDDSLLVGRFKGFSDLSRDRQHFGEREAAETPRLLPP